MIISFAWTTEAFLQSRKTVTRRVWAKRYHESWVKAWRDARLIHQAWNKLPRASGHPIGSIKLTCEPYYEKLADMPESDLEAEGGYWHSLEQFQDSFPYGAETTVSVVRFEPLPFMELKANG